MTGSTPPPPPPSNRDLSLGTGGSIPKGTSPVLGLGRGRGGGARGGSRGGKSAATPSSSLIQDQATRSTDSDAQISRLSAIKAGYLANDPFSHLFNISQQSDSAPTPSSSSNHQSHPAIISHQNHRRPPLINIGTYLRSNELDQMVETFLRSGKQKKQIVSLGAGSDSRFWRLNHSDLSDTLHHYLELDFPQLTSRKISSIMKSDLLRDSLSQNQSQTNLEDEIRIESENTTLKSSKYSLLPCDLRSFPSNPGSQTSMRNDAALSSSSNSFSTSKSINPSLTSSLQTSSSTDHSSTTKPLPATNPSILPFLDPSLPTLILCECVLAYLPPKEGDSVLRYFSDNFFQLKILCYDMCISGDGEANLDSETGNRDMNGNAAGGLRKLMDDDDESAMGLGLGEVRASRFGKVMLQNLESRNLYLPGARHYSTTSSNSRRFERILKEKVEQHGSHTSSQKVSPEIGDRGAPIKSGFKTLEKIWRELDGGERERLSKLEHLDEVEELEMLLRHYAISWSERGL